MIANEWITENWESLQQAARNVSKGHQLWPDLLNHCIADFLEKPKVEEIVKDGYAQFYIVRIMMNQWRSVTSPFFKQYRDAPSTSVEDTQLAEWYQEDAIDPEWDFEKVKAILEHMEEDKEDAGWYHKKLIELYAQTPNYKRLAEMTGISRTSISKSIQRARIEIKNRYYK